MEILCDETESDRKDRKCVNRARVHASAQSFDRCERVHNKRLVPAFTSPKHGRWWVLTRTYVFLT